MFSNYQRLLTNFGAILTWFALLAQLVLSLQTSTDPIPQTLIRFFSYFNNLTSIIVALSFTSMLFQESWLYRFFLKDGRFSAVVVYVGFVSAVYHLLLRPGPGADEMQSLVSELLHTIIPVFVLLYWFSFGEKQSLHWRYIPSWSVLLVGYSVYITIRGAITHEYPYFFIDAIQLGYPKALLHCFALFLLFGAISYTFIFLGKRIGNAKI